MPTEENREKSVPRTVLKSGPVLELAGNFVHIEKFHYK